MPKRGSHQMPKTNGASPSRAWCRGRRAADSELGAVGQRQPRQTREHIRSVITAHEDWLSLARDLIARGLGTPMLVVADGAPGLIRAVEQCWPSSDRQHCSVHRARNLIAKLPEQQRERVRRAYWKALDEAKDERDGRERGCATSRRNQRPRRRRWLPLRLTSRELKPRRSYSSFGTRPRLAARSQCRLKQSAWGQQRVLSSLCLGRRLRTD
jgi:hypothetical protein